MDYLLIANNIILFPKSKVL